MKSILISIRPEWVEKIANGIKSIEIRKSKPKRELPIDVLIYCTNGKPLTRLGTLWNGDRKTDVFSLSYPPNATCNGKVVAKFTLKKAEKFIQGLNEAEYERLPNFALKDYDYYGLEDLMEKACLNDEEINKYAPDLSFYAWHISDLEIFDEPKPLSEFGLKRPPQSYCYVEVEE